MGQINSKLPICTCSSSIATTAGGRLPQTEEAAADAATAQRRQQGAAPRRHGRRATWHPEMNYRRSRVTTATRCCSWFREGDWRLSYQTVQFINEGTYRCRKRLWSAVCVSLVGLPAGEAACMGCRCEKTVQSALVAPCSDVAN